jgi:hypothetical protein
MLVGGDQIETLGKSFNARAAGGEVAALRTILVLL